MGLLFGFQRPSRLSCRRLLATILFVAASPSFLPGGVSASISVRRLLSSCCFRRPAGFRTLQRRPVASADFLQRGAASTAWPPSLSTAASLTPSTHPPFLPGFFVGARLLPPPRLLSTRCVDCRIPYCRTDSLEVPSAPVRGLLCEGRGFYHRRVEGQQTSSAHTSRSSPG